MTDSIDKTFDEKVHRLHSELLLAARRISDHFYGVGSNELLSNWYLKLKGSVQLTTESLEFDDEKFVRFAYTRMRWQALDSLRRNVAASSMQIEGVDIDNLFSSHSESGASEDPFAVFDISHLTKTLSSDHPKWSTLLELRFVQGFSYRRTAETMGETSYWVKKNSHQVNE